VGQHVYMVGFGNTGSGREEHNTFGEKRWGTTPIESVTETLVWWRYDAGESNTAQGDSGGPQLVCAKRCSVVSVTSAGEEPNTYGSWSVATRVDSYADWIGQVVAGQVKPSGLRHPGPTPSPEWPGPIPERPGV
jgi:hypothetical protein